MRQDNREYNTIRKIKIERNYIKHAEGSCLIQVGNTRVVCTASVDESVPSFLKGSGKGWVTAEYGMIPRSCQIRISRSKSSGRTQEIQRLIGRSLRAVTDMEQLGERTVWIDCDVIQADGGTRTASITGSFIALIDCMANLKDKELIQSIPIEDYVAAISVGIIDGHPRLDLTYEEDSRADVDMNVVMTGEGKFIEIQGTAERAPFEKGQMDKLLELAKEGILNVIDIQRNLSKDLL